MGVLESGLRALVAASPLWQQGKTVLAACSGGADSLALTDVMRRQGEIDQVNVQVVHVQHHLRGDEAEQDAEVVERYCREHGLSFIRKDVEAETFAQEQGFSLEDAARRLRYEALETARQETGAVGIFLAHHQDDQAETVLLNLLRGSGTRGLRGMLPVSGYLARPFLTATRQDTETYCREEGLQYCEDSSNDDLSLRRNWVRKKLLPLLETQNPRIKKQLAQEAELAAGDEAYLEQKARWYLETFGRDVLGTQNVRVKEEFNNMPFCIRSRVIRLLVQQAGGGELTYDHVKSILAMLDKGIGNKSLDVPGNVRLIYWNGELMAGKKQQSREEERAAKLAKKEKQRNAGQSGK